MKLFELLGTPQKTEIEIGQETWSSEEDGTQQKGLTLGDFIQRKHIEDYESHEDWFLSNERLITLEGRPKAIQKTDDGREIKNYWKVRNFIVDKNDLTDLKGAPNEVIDVFDCSNNNLLKLEGSPSVVGFFDCSDNLLTNLKNCPQKITGNFYDSVKIGKTTISNVSFNCANNSINSLIGCPNEIPGSFIASNNALKDLDGCPLSIDGELILDNNNLTSKAFTSFISVGIKCKDVNFVDNKKLFSLRGIHQVFSEIDGSIRLSGCPISEGILDVLKINKLKSVSFPAEVPLKVRTLINDALKKINSGQQIDTRHIDIGAFNGSIHPGRDGWIKITKIRLIEEGFKKFV